MIYTSKTAHCGLGGVCHPEKIKKRVTNLALYYDLTVFKDVYKMTLRIFELTANFSREYKFTLGQGLKRDCILLVRSIYRANKCKDLKLISVKQQAELALLTENN